MIQAIEQVHLRAIGACGVGICQGGGARDGINGDSLSGRGKPEELIGLAVKDRRASLGCGGRTSSGSAVGGGGVHTISEADVAGDVDVENPVEKDRDLLAV